MPQDYYRSPFNPLFRDPKEEAILREKLLTERFRRDSPTIGPVNQTNPDSILGKATSIGPARTNIFGHVLDAPPNNTDNEFLRSHKNAQDVLGVPLELLSSLGLNPADPANLIPASGPVLTGKKFFHGTPKIDKVVKEGFDPSKYDLGDLVGWMTSAAERPGYAESYAFGQMKHQGDVTAPGIIPVETNAKNVLDTYNPDTEGLARLAGAVPQQLRDKIKEIFKAQWSGRFKDPGTQTYELTKILDRVHPEDVKKSGLEAFIYNDAGDKVLAVPDPYNIINPFTKETFNTPKPKAGVFESVELPGNTIWKKNFQDKTLPDYRYEQKVENLPFKNTTKSITDIPNPSKATGESIYEYIGDKGKLFEKYAPLYSDIQKLDTAQLENLAYDLGHHNISPFSHSKEDLVSIIQGDFIGNTHVNSPSIAKSVPAKTLGETATTYQKTGVIKDFDAKVFTENGISSFDNLNSLSPDELFKLSKKLGFSQPQSVDYLNDLLVKAKAKTPQYWADKTVSSSTPKGFIETNTQRFATVGQAGGTHGAKIVKSNKTGYEYVFKPNDQEFLNQSANIATELANYVNGSTPIEKLTKGGTIQRKLSGDLKTIRDLGGSEKFLTEHPEVIPQLQREQVIDWLIGNHDSHSGQFFFDEAGKKIIPFDKGQAFKHYGQDVLSADYHPNAAYGEEEPIYNTMMRMAKEGKIKLDFQPVYDAILKSDDYLMKKIETKKLGDYAKARYPNDIGKASDLYNQVFKRANNLLKDFKALYGVN